ncbi:unnamed protein product [Adineta steineri]|uniref:G-protein coupled receptors family 1 profile domain-containing protein n=1 Tax=Adineta steineri TaxID=433720 RepID=A0A814T5Q9_9BILA|nr:unnamed protein product [Adineta steineri]CAF3931574.1 unnamed protein product [Adineta steineri]
MSNSSIILSYQFIGEKITIYCGLFILITGVFGGILNILVFTTLKTFRNTSCVFYLITASIVDTAQLLTSLLVRILSVGFLIDPTTIPWFCKTRMFFAQFSILVALGCMSLATIDQFISINRRQLCSLQSAHRYIFITCIMAIIHAIFFSIYYDTRSNVCTIINPNFAKYYTYVYIPVVIGILPIITMITFALLAFISIRTIASRNIHIERLGRDRQLTAMTLIYVVFIIITNVPTIIFNIYLTTSVTTDKILLARNYLIVSIVVVFYYVQYAIPFYVFCCVSKRFRNQVIYVLIDVHFKRFQQAANKLNNNQVTPAIEMNTLTNGST